MAAIGRTASTGRSRNEMWVDDEGKSRVGGFFIDGKSRRAIKRLSKRKGNGYARARAATSSECEIKERPSWKPVSSYESYARGVASRGVRFLVALGSRGRGWKIERPN
ncbi:hypothetical protein KM043_013529 [Ampulex compressa]|nr:hypothetical protein KM043_013529 [Ampulex compressa]